MIERVIDHRRYANDVVDKVGLFLYTAGTVLMVMVVRFIAGFF